MNTNHTAAAGTATSVAAFDRIMARCADRSAAIALTLPPRPTSADILRVITLAYVAGAEQALQVAEKLRVPPQLAHIRLSSSRPS